MNIYEKFDLLNSLYDMTVLSNDHFLILKGFYEDDDSSVRSTVASLLVNFVNEETVNILITLACDDEPIVRTEAYDSLSVFPYNNVKNFLLKAIQTESDDLACSYAILSWVDVVLGLNQVTADNINFLKYKKSIEKSDDCLLSYSYGLYLFGEKAALKELLSFLKHDDYHHRCGALSLLRDVLNEDNKGIIKDAVLKLIEEEDTVAVKDSATRFISNI